MINYQIFDFLSKLSLACLITSHIIIRTVTNDELLDFATKIFKMKTNIIKIMTGAGNVDKVKRPDHYRCLDCREKFNDAKFLRKETQGIHSAVASCPSCESTRIKISWWKKQSKA